MDQEGRDVAACLGYIHRRAFNFSHLTRQDRSPLDKYSPGFYLVFWTIEALYREQTADWFFFGPGDYDYKPGCLGEPFPVYRYERLNPLNLGGLIKLWNRGRKERRRWRQDHLDEGRGAGNG